MNKENREIYDRNIRLWGNKTQEIISNSNVLLANLASEAISEVAKNLILSGVNIILYDENEKVQMKDAQSNFFFCVEDISKNKAVILQKKLFSINPLVKIRIFTLDNIKLKPSEIQCAVCDNRGLLYSYIEIILKEIKITTYYIDIREPNGFFINNIEIPGMRELEKQNTIRNDYILLDDDDAVPNQDREIAINQEEIIIDDDSDNDAKKIIKRELSYCALMQKFKSMNRLFNKCHIKHNEIYSNYWFYISKYLYQIKDTLVKEDFYKEANIGNDNEVNHKLYTVSCVIAGLVSLEVIKIISMTEIPNCNLYAYDCDSQQGDFWFFK